MTTETIQIRRGLNSQRTSVIFYPGEPVWTLDTQQFYVGDGVTPGGILVSNTSGNTSGSNYNFSGLGTVTVSIVGNTVFISGANSTGSLNTSGYITTGNADLRYYPLNGNPSGFLTGNSLPSTFFGANTGLIISGAGTYTDSLSGYGYKTNFFNVSTGTGQIYTAIINMQSGFPGAVLNYVFNMASGINMSLVFQTSGGANILTQSGLGYPLQVSTSFIYNGTGWINTYWA